MSEPSLHLVHTFVTVVEHNSFARAAEALAMTPSSASRLVKALEQHLGATLLNRTTRAMSLTDAGQRYFAECSNALAQVRGAYEMVRDEQDLPRGTLVVSAPVAFGHSHVVPHLAGFLEACPHVQLDLRLSDGYVDLVAEGVMLALRIGRLKDSSLIAHKLLDNRRILVAAPAYLDCHGTPTALEDLYQHQCLVSSASQDGKLWRLFCEGEERTLEPRGRIKGDNADAIRRLCIDGLGIAFHSVVTMAAAIHAGDLIQILPQWTGRETGVYCVRPQRRMGLAAKTFIEFLAARWRDADATPSRHQ
ncbi:LysR family transcriptional regulator [Collimonas sp. NPDC087041]|uniref:LysR family transcriptional regulator n=1 Tax=Collimonas sp. NPDC087041 TaxID=3363960 RepID=UPI00382FF3E7